MKSQINLEIIFVSLIYQWYLQRMKQIDNTKNNCRKRILYSSKYFKLNFESFKRIGSIFKNEATLDRESKTPYKKVPSDLHSIWKKGALGLDLILKFQVLDFLKIKWSHERNWISSGFTKTFAWFQLFIFEFLQIKKNWSRTSLMFCFRILS